MQVQKIFLAMLFAFQVYASPIKDFLIIDDWQQPLVFWLENLKPIQLKTLTLNFLESNDCQSAYWGRYHLEDASTKLQAHQVFSLDTHQIYQAMQQMGAPYSIRSVLIRLKQYPQGWASFEGGCADQGINCCIPMVCSQETKDCILQVKHHVQALYF